jgi:hypothetical protein
MKQVYNVLDNVKAHFESNGITNRVTYGTQFELDTDKTQIMPIAHLDILDVTYDNRVIVFRMLVMCLGWVDKVKVVDPDDTFYGDDNQQDVLNTQLAAMTRFINSLRRGDLYENNIRLYEEPTAEMLQDLGENQLAGWGAEVQIQVPNDTSIC